jgi:hypothetical protein
MENEPELPERKKRGRGRPRLTTNRHIARRKMALRRRAEYAEEREIDTRIQLDSLGVLEEVLRHFYFKARILESLKDEGDYDQVDRAWEQTGRWAEKVALFRHPRIASIRLAGDPNQPVLPADITPDELRRSIVEDFERLRAAGVLDFPRLPQGDVDKS